MFVNIYILERDQKPDNHKEILLSCANASGNAFFNLIYLAHDSRLSKSGS